MTNDDLKLLARFVPQNAPAAVETALLREFRKRKAARRWMVAGAAIAAGLLAIGVLWSPEPPAMEVTTEFFALPGSSMLPPLDSGTLVRVELPRSALTLVGLPVNENRALERVRADVLLGQDGEARAVRFIQ